MTKKRVGMTKKRVGMTQETFEALEFGICLGFRISSLGFSGGLRICWMIDI
jgi:hypothetical protein